MFSVSVTAFLVTPVLRKKLLPSLFVVEVEAKEDLTACPNNSAHRASKALNIEFMMTNFFFLLLFDGFADYPEELSFVVDEDVLIVDEKQKLKGGLYI